MTAVSERRSTTALARKTLLVAILFGLLFGIGFLRNPDLFLHPALAVDDARHFRDYYNSLGEDRIFYHVSIGYLIVVPQLLGSSRARGLEVNRSRVVPSHRHVVHIANRQGKALGPAEPTCVSGGDDEVDLRLALVVEAHAVLQLEQPVNHLEASIVDG